MTLQTSGAITLAQIQTEFGGANPISMNEYYAGGTYVPSGTSGTNGAVPSSGQISFSQFYGTSDFVMPTITLGNHDLVGEADNVDPLNTTVYFTLNSSGQAQADFSSTSASYLFTVDTVDQGAAGTYNIDTWLDGGAAGDVAVYVTNTGSALLAGSSALSTYLNLGTTRT